MTLRIVRSGSREARLLIAEGYLPLMEFEHELHFDVPESAGVYVSPHRKAEPRRRRRTLDFRSLRRREKVVLRIGQVLVTLGGLFLVGAAATVFGNDSAGCGTPTGCIAPEWGISGWLTVAMGACFIAAGLAFVIEKRIDARASALEVIESRRQEQLEITAATEATTRRGVATRDVRPARPRNVSDDAV